MNILVSNGKTQNRSHGNFLLVEKDVDQPSLTKSKKYLAWILLTKHSTVTFQSGRSNIKGINAACFISVVLFSNYVNWNSSEIISTTGSHEAERIYMS